MHAASPFVCFALFAAIATANCSAQEAHTTSEPAAKTREWDVPPTGRLLPSPDGKSLLVYGTPRNLDPSPIALYDSSSGETRWKQDSPEGAYTAAFSPDGKWLAERPLRFILTIRSTETGEKLAALEDCGDFAITPDSRGVIYRDHRTGEIVHWQLESKSVVAKRVLPEGSTHGQGVLISPEADCVVVSNWDNQKTDLLSFSVPELTAMGTYRVYSRDDWLLGEDGKSLVASVRYAIDEKTRRLAFLSLPDLKLQTQARPHASITCIAPLPARGRYLLGTSAGLSEAARDGDKLLIGNSSAWQLEADAPEVRGVDAIAIGRQHRFAAICTSQYIRGNYCDALRIFDLATEGQVAMFAGEPKSRFFDATFVADDGAVAFLRTRGFGKTLTRQVVVMPLAEIRD